MAAMAIAVTATDVVVVVVVAVAVAVAVAAAVDVVLAAVGSVGGVVLGMLLVRRWPTNWVSISVTVIDV